MKTYSIFFKKEKGTQAQEGMWAGHTGGHGNDWLQLSGGSLSDTLLG